MRISDWSSDVCSSDLLALGIADALEAQGIGADVVSMPCWSLFDAQQATYKADLLPSDALKVSIEAGTTFGWERYTGLDGLRFGIDSFGASAPAEALFDYFGLTRSEKHTSELQSLMRISYAVFCLKKQKKQHTTLHI